MSQYMQERPRLGLSRGETIPDVGATSRDTGIFRLFSATRRALDDFKANEMARAKKLEAEAALEAGNLALKNSSENTVEGSGHLLLDQPNAHSEPASEIE